MRSRSRSDEVHALARLKSAYNSLIQTEVIMKQIRSQLVLTFISFQIAAFQLSPYPIRTKCIQSQSKFLSTTSLRSTRERAIKPWPKPIVESSGDYQGESFLEDHIGGPLYSLQKDLPRLPVPPISKTLKTFLPSALPLAESKEEEDSLIKACEDFPQEAERLQERLKARAAELKDSSWLQSWWNILGYLSCKFEQCDDYS